ncbi:MAG TPA: hypothetical protein VGI92_13290, partial [Gemmatimonadales bacterium]
MIAGEVGQEHRHRSPVTRVIKQTATESAIAINERILKDVNATPENRAIGDAQIVLVSAGPAAGQSKGSARLQLGD